MIHHWRRRPPQERVPQPWWLVPLIFAFVALLVAYAYVFGPVDRPHQVPRGTSDASLLG